MEEPNEIRLFQSSLFIKLLENELEVFKVKDPVLYYFLLKLKVSFNFTPGYVNKCSEVTKILSKKSLKICPGQGFHLIPMFMLVLARIDLSEKKKKLQIEYVLT